MSIARRPPIVGIPLLTVAGSVTPRIGQNVAYFTALVDAGATPLPLPQGLADAELHRLYELCDAVLIAGGPDVDPSHYGAKTDPGAGVHVDTGLDALDFPLLRWTLDDRKPLFAICRGMQLLNVAMGGTLYQDLEREAPGDVAHREKSERDAAAHEVKIDPDSLLAELTGATTVEVNSIHHQGVRALGAGLRAVATAADGLVEALELPGHPFLLAVQWHPEEMYATSAWSRGLFRAFVDSVAQPVP